MARKPKAARSNDFAVSPEQVLAALGDAPAPVSRGRRPKAAASPEPVPALDGDAAAGGTADVGGTVAGPGAAPVRKRPGPKPKGWEAAAAASLLQEAEVAGRPEPDAGQPGAAAEPAATGDGAMGAELAHPVGSGESSDAPAGDAAPPSPGQDAAPAAKPAAQWDRETGTVRFDWTEVERTASRDGPDQAMAKLLVAARAEGANSRWPL